MRLKRVVITGVGTVTPLGRDVPALIAGLERGTSSVKRMNGWEEFSGLRSLVGAPAVVENEREIPRQSRRTMGRMSIFAAQAAGQAVTDAGLDSETLSSGQTGCIIGSTMGGAESLNEAFETMLVKKDLSLLSSVKFFQCVSHTAAMNVAQYLNIQGCVMATSAACASALQGIGTGYDLIRLGKQDVALCGGAEELHPSVTVSFEVIYATSTNFNEDPKRTPRPFDSQRDGLVCGEGSGIVVLEEYQRARRRGAKIYAEVIGYWTCGSGSHVSQSNKDAIMVCMRKALASANISQEDVNYINAHATATVQGDTEEAQAIRSVFGDSVPVSSLKGYLGHTLGASGAIELIACLDMMSKGRIIPTLNLDVVAQDCEGILHVQKPMDRDINVFIKNCFAFGGINATLVCKKIDQN